MVATVRIATNEKSFHRIHHGALVCSYSSNTCSLGSLKPASQTASRSVQPVCETRRQTQITKRATSLATGRISAMHAMRPETARHGKSGPKLRIPVREGIREKRRPKSRTPAGAAAARRTTRRRATEAIRQLMASDARCQKVRPSVDDAATWCPAHHIVTASSDALIYQLPRRRLRLRQQRGAR